ncbi:MAG TPA: SRPBCC family protein [Candidatus Sulfotelmatobacter sp.]|nr:SRPBCC family protein [Candidatus Sulfotelmatobacter sp.]
MAEKGTATAEKISSREIVLTRIFDAPRELVWNAWTDPKQVARWWGPRGFTTTIHEMDLRPGGRWRQTMHGPDGAAYPCEFVFSEVVSPKRIVYSMKGGKKGGRTIECETTWTFEALDGKTKLTLRMVFASASDAEFAIKTHGAIEGGEQTLARLGEYLADWRTGNQRRDR